MEKDYDEYLLNQLADPIPQIRISEASYLPNGFSVINNEMLEKLFASCSVYEFAVAIRIWRQTCGFGRKKDKTNKREEFSMSYSQLINGKNKQNGDVMFHGVKMSRRQLTRVLKSLYLKNIIFYYEGEYKNSIRAFNVYSFNEKHETWLVNENIRT